MCHASRLALRCCSVEAETRPAKSTVEYEQLDDLAAFSSSFSSIHSQPILELSILQGMASMPALKACLDGPPAAVMNYCASSFSLYFFSVSYSMGWKYVCCWLSTWCSMDHILKRELRPTCIRQIRILMTISEALYDGSNLFAI